MKDLRSINFNTQVCAVIGNPVAHSLSPVIHNAAYAALDLDFLYLPCQVEDVAAALTGMRAFHNFRGMSVTIPHKIEAMKHVDEIAEADRTIGAINTIVKENDRLIGLGTDGPGALKALLDAGVLLAGKTALILGCGGAARAIAFTLALQRDLAELRLLAGNASRLQGLADDLKNHTDTPIVSAPLTAFSLAAAMEAADILIQCTPVGMHPRENATLVPADLFRPGQVVFDIVYTPLETRLLTEARANGLQVISGVEMFINQAVLQFERFTGREAPEELMRRVVLERLQP